MGRRPHSRPAARMTSLVVVCLGALLAAPPAAAVAAPPLQRDTVLDGPGSEVFGRVLDQDTGEGVGQARLLFRRLVDDSVIDSVSVSTGDDGAFHFDFVPAGTYALVTEHLGFATRRDTLRVPVSKSVRMTLSLAAEPVELRPLQVRVRSGFLVENGFYRRRSKGFGQFLTPDELDRRPLNNLTQALKTVPGVRYARICNGGRCREGIVMSLSVGRARCSPKYFMNGDEMHGTVYPNDISMQDVVAVEIYRSISETPAEFYGRCGSVVMWTRRSDS